MFFMPVRMPAARKPEMMFEIVLPACQIAMRRGFSVLVYHEEVTSCVLVGSFPVGADGWLTEGDSGHEGSLAESDEEATDGEPSTTEYDC